MQQRTGTTKAVRSGRRLDAAGTRVIMMVVMLAVMAAACGDANDPAAPGSVASVTVSPATGSLDVGGTLDLTAIVRSSHGDTLSGRTVAWSSSDTTVARISAAGRATAVRAGTAVITAASGGRSGHATLTVQATAPAPTVTALEPASIAAGLPGFTLTIRGTGFLPQSRLQWNGGARPTEYVSPTELRATIFEGDITAVGTVRIQIVNALPGGGASGQVDFPVTAQAVPVALVELGSDIAVTAVGSPVQVSVTVRDAAGGVLSGRLISWSSSNALVATVNGAGLVSTMGEGEATITATSEGRTATLALTVTHRPYHLVFDEADALSWFNLRLGTQQKFWQHGTGMRAVDASVSPDRRWYAYVIHIGTSRDIGLLDIVNRTYRWITSDGTSDQPEWSPAGDRILFRSDRSGHSGIWTMAPDGTDLFNVTAGLPASWIIRDQVGSQSGFEIAFSGGPAGMPEGIHIIRANGTYLQPIGTGLGRALEPSWRGADIAFTLKSADGTSDIWRASTAGIGPLMRLTESGRAGMPSWSPDGRWIAWVEAPSSAGPARIMATRPFAGEQRTIIRFPTGSAGGFRPGWVTVQ